MKKRTFDDVEVFDIEIFKKLAAKAPPLEHEKPEPEEPSPESGSTKRSSGPPPDLGRVDVGKYLTHYGIPYKKKDQARQGRTIYVITCVFNSEHGQDASLIQLSDGKIVYQCFHDGCEGKMFPGPGGAREKISGKDSMAPFQAGYDPKYHGNGKHKKKRTSEKKGPPWMRVGRTGKLKFVPKLLAEELHKAFKPVIHEYKTFGNQFWRYNEKKGMWILVDNAEIEKKIDQMLGNDVSNNRVNEGREALARKTYIHPDKFEPNPMWANLKNCMLNLQTGERKHHHQSFNSKIQLPVTYDPKARCPLWIQTLREIYQDNYDYIKFMQEFFGYCLYPKIIIPAAVFQIGAGNNGKGTIEHVLITMIGAENCSHLTLSRMEKQYAMSELRFKLINTAGETTTKPVEVEKFKQASAGDHIQAERKYLPDVIFQPYAKYLFSANSFPRTTDQSNAFFRRVYVIKHEREFDIEKDEDTSRKEKLMDEMNGIFMWAWEGLQRFLARGRFDISDKMRESKKAYRARVNSVVLFTDEECLMKPDSFVGCRSLFEEYVAFCEEAHIQEKGLQSFYEAMETIPGVKKTKERVTGRHIFRGLGLRSKITT